METWKLIASFLTGGLAGAIFKSLWDKYQNRIQKLNCYYIEDEVISKLPITFGDTTQENLQSKRFKIINTTNRDIKEIKVVFEFESNAVVTKWNTYSKAGVDIPKGKIFSKKNECQFILKHFNRGEEVEIYLEIANIVDEQFNITELNITGVKIKYIDKRKKKVIKPVKMVEKRKLTA